jgi:hypothetical protein
MNNRLETIKNKIQNCNNPTLHLDNLGISDEEIKFITDEINKRQYIAILHLSNNHISDVGATILGQHLISASAVTLDGNNITDAGFYALIKSEKFTMIDVEDNPIENNNNLYNAIITSSNITKIMLEYTNSSFNGLDRHFALKRENLKVAPAIIAEENVLYSIKMINRLLYELVLVGRAYLADTQNPSENDLRLAKSLAELNTLFDDINEQKYNYNNVLIPQWIPLPITLTGMKERCLLGKLSQIFINESTLRLNGPCPYPNDIDLNLCLKVRSLLANYKPFEHYVNERIPESDLNAQIFKNSLVKLYGRLLSLGFDPSHPRIHYVSSWLGRRRCEIKTSAGAYLEEKKQVQTSVRNHPIVVEPGLASKLLKWICRKPISTHFNEEKAEPDYKTVSPKHIVIINQNNIK